MAIVKYLVKKEDIPFKARNKGTEEPIVLIGSTERPIYLLTVGMFCGDIFVSVFETDETGIIKDKFAMLEQKINDLLSVNTELEKLITKYTNSIDNDEEELENSSFFICDNPECSEHLVHNPLYVGGEWVCPMCGEAVRETVLDEPEEVEFDRLKEIASILIMELIDNYNISINEMEFELGIGAEEIEYITGC